MARLAVSLVVLRDEINRAAPNRNKASDGWIGDAAHRDRDSRHNPNRFDVVTAFDATHDPGGGLDAHDLADAIVAGALPGGRHPELAYVISASRIASRSTDWHWHRYGGVNPHDRLIHVAVGTGRDGDPMPPYDSSRSWGVYRPTEPAEAEAMAGPKTDRALVGVGTTPTGGGYWVADAAGGVFSFGNAQYFGSVPELVQQGKVPARRPRCVDLVAHPNGRGYWLLDAGGGVYAFGAARYRGSVPQIRARKPDALPPGGWRHMAVTHDGGGYLMLHRYGSVAAFGDAHYHGRVTVV